jgi:hypothetical protein
MADTPAPTTETELEEHERRLTADLAAVREQIEAIRAGEDPEAQLRRQTRTRLVEILEKMRAGDLDMSGVYLAIYNVTVWLAATTPEAGRG